VKVTKQVFTTVDMTAVVVDVEFANVVVVDVVVVDVEFAGVFALVIDVVVVVVLDRLVDIVAVLDADVVDVDVVDALVGIVVVVVDMDVVTVVVVPWVPLRMNGMSTPNSELRVVRPGPVAMKVLPVSPWYDRTPSEYVPVAMSLPRASLWRRS
jgi:hypothetical protein